MGEDKEASMDEIRNKKRAVRRKRPGDVTAGARRQPDREPGRPAGARRRPDTGPEQRNRQEKRSAATTDRGRTGRRKKVKKTSRFPVLTMVVLLVSVCVFVFSAYQLVMSLIPYYQGGQVYAQVKKVAVEDTGEKNGFHVDFKTLKSQNPDTVAWIRFDEPKVISYPVVKSLDNTEYLTKTFVDSENKLGSIFMDMRSASDFTDRNTFIYGHNLKLGGEMFSQLLDYEKEDFVKKHPYFYIYTPDGKQRTYQIFSAAVVKDTADNYKMEYGSDAAFGDYLQMCSASSLYKVDTDVPLDPSARIVSLSTCTNVRDEDRFLVQGVLVEEAGGVN